MATKAPSRPPIRLDYGEWALSASTYHSPGYNVHPLKMQNGFIDLNNSFSCTPSYKLIQDITFLNNGGAYKYEKTYWIANWYRETLATDRLLGAFLIFHMDPLANKRYYSMLKKDGTPIVTSAEVGDIVGPPNLVAVGKNFIIKNPASYLDDPLANKYPYLCGHGTLLYLARDAAQTFRWATLKVLTGSTADDRAYKEVTKPRDFCLFQNRFWIVCEGPRLGILPQDQYIGQGVIASMYGQSNNFMTPASPDYITRAALDFQVFLEGDEEILNIAPCATVLIISTTSAVRVIKSGDTQQQTIGRENITTNVLIYAACNGARARTFYSMIFIPTKDGLIHRQIASVEQLATEGTESLVLRIRDDDQEITHLEEDPRLHLLLARKKDGTIAGFRPPIIIQTIGGIIAPATSYLNLGGDCTVIDILEDGNVVIQRGVNEYIFERDLGNIPSLRLNSFEYTATRSDPNYAGSPGLWHVHVAGYDVATNRIIFHPNNRLINVVGLGILFGNEFFCLQKEVDSPTDFTFVSCVDISTLVDITTIVDQWVRNIPETRDLASYTQNPGALGAEFGFMSGGKRHTFASDNQTISMATLDKTKIYIAENFYAGSVFAELHAMIDWFVPAVFGGIPTYNIITDHQLTRNCTMAQTNGYRTFRYHDIHESTRGSTGPSDLMSITVSPKKKYEKGDPRKESISIIE